MAILEDLGLEVKILVNNIPLREYEDKNADPTYDEFGNEIRKCRRYVEVVENAEYAVQLHVTSVDKYLDNTEKGFYFVLDLDGQEHFENQILDQECRSYLVEGKSECDGRESTIRKFCFTAMSIGRCPRNLR